jgi:starch synthase
MFKNKKIRVLLAAAEIYPFVKVGGLADVLGSLPQAIKKLGVDVRLIMPKYGQIDKKKYKLKLLKANLPLKLKNKLEKIDIWQAFLPNSDIMVYFISHKKYFSPHEVYWEKGNEERFIFFSYALTKIFKIIDFFPDIIHCHDYHTAMIPDILKTSSENSGIKTLYTIHNLNFQGISGKTVLQTVNLNKDSLGILRADAEDGNINFMAQGILSADFVNTVSPTYAAEIATSVYGAKLHKVIQSRKKDLFGVLNGIDQDNYNPSVDKNILENYTVKTISKKIKNKLYLQKKLSFEQNKNILLVGCVFRLSWQKGIDLISDLFLQQDIQLVILGKGEKKYEENFKILEEKYPQKLRFINKVDLMLAQEIYSGADLFLMPSRFEPCGLGQMIAMRYGTLPLVRKTGGLADTVDDTCGFLFEEISERDLSKSLIKAANVFYKDSAQWKRMQINAMKKDFSWIKSAQKYVETYNNLLKK